MFDLRQQEVGSSLRLWNGIQNQIESECFQHVRQIQREEDGDSRDKVSSLQGGVGRRTWLQIKRAKLDYTERPGSMRERWVAIRVPEVLSPPRPGLEWMVGSRQTTLESTTGDSRVKESSSDSTGTRESSTSSVGQHARLENDTLYDHVLIDITKRLASCG
jgi:hypothetical protein